MKHKVQVFNKDLPDYVENRDIKFHANGTTIIIQEGVEVVLSDTAYECLKNAVQTRYKPKTLERYQFNRFGITYIEEIIDNEDRKAEVAA